MKAGQAATGVYRGLGQASTVPQPIPSLTPRKGHLAMGEISKRLRDRRLQVWEQAKALADVAAEQNRAFDATEQGTWDALNEEIGNLDARIKSVLEGEQRAKDADSAFAKLEGKPRQDGKRDDNNGTNTRGGDSGESDISRELRSFLRGETGRTYDVMPQGIVNYRTLSKLTAAAGLNTVPTSFYDRLVQHMIESSAVLQAGPTVLNTAGGETIQIPKTTAHSAAAIVTEGAAIAASDPTFGQMSLGAYKYGLLIQISRELLNDTGVDLEGYLSSQAGRALGNAFGAHMITGTGTAQPTGIVTAATVGITGGAGVTGAFTADNLIDLYYSVIAPYRNSSSAAWLMKDSTIAALRKVKDTTGQYIWQPGLQVGIPDSLLGKPIFTDPGVAATGLGGKSVVFGDFSQYFVRIAGGLRLERSDDFAFNTDLVTFRALMRADATLVDLSGALKVFVGNAA